MNLLMWCLAAYSVLVTMLAVSAIREANRLSDRLMEYEADADL